MAVDYKTRVRKEYLLTERNLENTQITPSYVVDTPVLLKEFSPASLGVQYCLENFMVYTNVAGGYHDNGGGVLTLKVEVQTSGGTIDILTGEPVFEVYVPTAGDGNFTYDVADDPSVLWIRRMYFDSKVRISVSSHAVPADVVRIVFDFSVRRIKHI